MTTEETEVAEEESTAEEIVEAKLDPPEEGTPAIEEVSEKLGIPAIVGSSDHQFLGRLWIGVALLLGVFATVLGVILTLAQRNESFLESSSSHAALFSTYRVGLVFMFMVPLLLGLATYIVPKQIGAKSLVFPRAGFGAFWGWLIGMGLFITAWAIDGGIAPRGSQEAVELSLLALALIIISLLVATVSLISTIIVSRVQNMTLWQIPFFSWSMLVAGSIWLLSLPVMLANILNSWIDLRGTSTTLYGAPKNLYAQIDWVFSQPQVFVFAVPLLGIFADIVVASQGKRPKRYETFQLLIAMTAVLSFGAYAQEFYSPNVSQTPVFVVGAVLLLMVSFAFVAGWLKYAASRKLNPPVILATLAILAFFAALVVGVLKVLGNLFNFLSNFNTGNQSYQDGLAGFVEPLIGLKGTVIGSAILHLVVVAGLLGATAGLYYWATKIAGTQPKPLLTIGSSLLALGGGILWATGDIINGFLGMPANPLDIETITPGMQRASVLSIVGAIAVALAVLGLVFEALRVFIALRKQEAVIENPYNAPTLEWAQDDVDTGIVTNAFPLWQEDEN